MPGTILTSDDIASRFGGFGVNTMAADPFAEHVGGRALSMGAAAGGTLLTGGMALAGIDPLSMGLRSGIGALAGGGSLTGAAAMGLGAAGAVALPMLAGSYAVNQMFHGAQQQQHLNSTLRSNYRHMGGQGQGFNRAEMGSIGSGLREMSHQMGPGGEVASYGELTSMVGQMSQLGLTKGVKDVQEFSKRFKEMVDAAKVMARELGTTLQGATEAMGSMRQMGVFGTGSQMQFATQARHYAMAGGLAMSEVTAMGSIGSQISRSVGGRGRQGAMGGMKAIGTVGSALQAGVLSDENIFDATGLTGAEGRQAMATNMMAKDANFLRGTRGRYFMAQMADANGNLDAGVAQEFMAGGMSVERTKELSQRALGKIGRADFIRNESRLRGEVLEQFGGNVNVMALQGWAAAKGIDINNMDDRSMILGQRQTGLGRDEFENALKMAKGMPEIARQQENSATNDRMLRGRADKLSTTGMAGLKKNFDKFKHELNSSFEQAGADIEGYVSNQIERFFNEQAGIYTQQIHSQLGSAINEMQTGRGSGNLRRLTGVKGGAGKFMASSAGAGSTAIDDFYGKNDSALTRMSRVHGTRASQFESAGYRVGGLGSDSELVDKMEQIHRIQSAGVGGSKDAYLRHLGVKYKDQINNLMSFGKGKGENFLANAASALGEMGVGDDLLAAFSGEDEGAAGRSGRRGLRTVRGTSMAEKARILREIGAGANTEAGALASRLDTGGLDTSVGGAGKYHTAADRDNARMVQMLGHGVRSVGQSAAGKSYALGWGGGTDEKAIREAKEMETIDREARGIVNSEGFSDLQTALASGNPSEINAAKKAINKKLQVGGTDAERQAYGSLLAGADYMELVNKGKKITEEDSKKILANRGIELSGRTATEQLRGMAQGQAAAQHERQQEALQAAVVQIREQSTESYARISAAGNIVETDQGMALSDSMKAITKGNSKVENYMLRGAAAAKAGSKLEAGGVGSYYDAMDAQRNALGSMSAEDLRVAAKAARASGNMSEAASLERQASSRSKFDRSEWADEGGKKHLNASRAGTTLASELGVEFDKTTKAEYTKALASGDTDTAARMLTGQMGIGNDTQIDMGGQKMSVAAALKQGLGSAEDMERTKMGIEQSPEAREARNKKGAEAARAKDPLLAEMVDIAKRQEDALKQIAKSSGVVASNTLGIGHAELPGRETTGSGVGGMKPGGK